MAQARCDKQYCREEGRERGRGRWREKERGGLKSGPTPGLSHMPPSFIRQAEENPSPAGRGKMLWEHVHYWVRDSIAGYPNSREGISPLSRETGTLAEFCSLRVIVPGASLQTCRFGIRGLVNILNCT